MLELRAAIPAVELVNTNEFIPQALNLQALDGISFKKGCYTGQETVLAPNTVASTNVRPICCKVKRNRHQKQAMCLTAASVITGAWAAQC